MKNSSETVICATLELAGRSETQPYAPARDDTSCDVALEDWDTLLSAVEDRLTALVSGHVDHSCIAVACGMSCVVQTSVRECVSALDQLHTTHTHERTRRQELERELQRLQFLLTQACDELASARASEPRARLVG